MEEEPAILLDDKTEQESVKQNISEEIPSGFPGGHPPTQNLPPVFVPTNIPRPYDGGSSTPEIFPESWQPSRGEPFALGSVPAPRHVGQWTPQGLLGDPVTFIPVDSLGMLPGNQQHLAAPQSGPPQTRPRWCRPPPPYNVLRPPRRQASSQQQQMWLPIGQPIQVLAQNSAQPGIPDMTRPSMDQQSMPMMMDFGFGQFVAPGQVPGQGPMVTPGGLWFPPQQPSTIPLFPDARSNGYAQPMPPSGTVFFGSEPWGGSTGSGSGDVAGPRASGLRPAENVAMTDGEIAQLTAAAARMSAADPPPGHPFSDAEFVTFVREHLNGMTGPRRAAVLQEIRAVVDDLEGQD